MRRAWWWGSLALFLSSCLELTLPSPPGAGSLSGTLVYFRPGRATPIPATNAKVKLKNTSLATVANADGLFRLEPITSPRGEVLVTLDIDGDGKPDRQRVIDLATVGAGPGKAIALGQVTLGLNATIAGTVLRDDLGAAAGGHRGTTVLVPEGPYATTCADDGSFLLPDLPDGPVNIAFFRDGYDLVVLEAVARAGEDVRLAPVRLVRSMGAPTAGVLRGRVVGGDGAALAGVVVHLGRGGAEQTQVTTQADGVFRFDSLGSGPYDLAATKEGLLTVTVRNALVAGGETLVGDLVLVAGQSTPPDFSVLPGLMDAGVVDAGAVDAGGFDGGADAGPPRDAGVDAGLRVDGGGVLPEAIITPSPIAVAMDDLNDAGFVSFTVEGGNSVGTRPLQYTWESLDVGDGLLWALDSAFASKATFSFSVMPQVRTYQIRLYVTDPQNQASEWTNAEVRVSYRPVAVLEPAVTTVGTTVTLSCANSTDQGNLQLAHRFVLVSGSATLTPRGALVDVTSTTPGSVVVGCEVENTFGLVSARDTSRITFTGQVDAGLSLTVSAPQSVDAGTVVTLVGTVVDAPGAVSASWSELTPPSPAIALDGSDTLTASFTAPPAVGGDQQRRFRLEVRSPPLCTGGPPTCLSAAAETSVIITDRAGPIGRLVGTQPFNHAAPVVLEFDEPVTSVTSLNARIFNGAAQAAAVVVAESSTRYLLVPDVALPVGQTLEVRLSGTLQDTVRGTQTAGQTLPFTVRASTVTTVNSAVVSTAPTAPRPGIAVVTPRPGGPSETTAVIAGWRDNQTMLFLPVSPTAVGLTEVTTTSVSGLVGNNPSRRLVAAGTRVFALIDTASGPSWTSPIDGALFTLDTSAPTPAWTRATQMQTAGIVNWPTSAPGPIFTDGTSLFTAAVTSNGLQVARSLSSGQWPDFIVNPGLGETVDGVSSMTPPGQTRATASVLGTTRALATLYGSSLVLRRSAAINSWTTITPSPNLTYSGSAPKSLRMALVNGIGAVVAAAPNVASSDVLQLNSHIAGSPWSANLPLPAAVVSPTSAFDLVSTASGTHLLLAAVTQGKLFVWRRSGVANSPWETLDGRNGDQSLHDLACTPDNPELALTADGVFVTWAERCAGSWRVAMARIE